MTIKNLKALKGMDTDKVAQAIEADAGQALPGLRESLAEAKAGKFAAVHTPAAIEARKRGRPAGSVKASPKVVTTIRLDADVLTELKKTGPGWQTRANDALRAHVFVSGARPVATFVNLTSTPNAVDISSLSDVDVDAVLKPAYELQVFLSEQREKLDDVVKNMEALVGKTAKKRASTT